MRIFDCKALLLRQLHFNVGIALKVAHILCALCRAFLNPGAGKRRTGISSSPWAAQEGQDFLANHVVPAIDLVTTHIWADNWMG